MPRQARLDAPGTPHHVIIRVIERKEIVKDDHYRQNFVYRMMTIALENGTLIYCGHSVLMGKVKNDWPDRDYVLKWFGGGLILSQGGWSAVKALKSGSRHRKITIVISQLACVP